MPAAAAAAKPQQQGSSRPAKSAAAAQQGRGLAAGVAQAGAAQPKQQKTRTASKGPGKNKGDSRGGVSMEFTPRAAGDISQQPKLHQTTLKDTLKRAHRNKQRAQQEDGGSEQQQGGDMQGQDEAAQQQQDGCASGGQQAKPAAVRKRKHSSMAAGAAGAGAGSGGGSGGAGSGARAAGSGGGRAKRAAKVSKMAAALEAAVETLDTWSLSTSSAPQQQQQQGQNSIILDATLAGTAVWEQLQEDLASSEGVALGVLYSKTVLQGTAGAPMAVQYFSSLQRPYKAQAALLSKAASYAKRQAAAGAADTGGEADAAGVQELVGLAVMPVLPGSNSAAGAGAPAATAGVSYYLSLQQQEEGQLPPHIQQLLQAVLCDARKWPCVCCSAKAVLCSLAERGLQLPAASDVTVIDPVLLGWLLDPQVSRV